MATILFLAICIKISNDVSLCLPLSVFILLCNATQPTMVDKPARIQRQKEPVYEQWKPSE